MVEKKFNFYNVYNTYYKNINESVFFYDHDSFKDFEPELYIHNPNLILINYFGIFFCISSDFIINTNLFLLNTIFKNKKKPLSTVFSVKKYFYKTSFSYRFFFKKNKKLFFLKKNLFLIKL